jgi:hypothetical protein
MHSVRKNFENIPCGSIPTSRIMTDIMPLNWKSSLHQREDIQVMFEDFVTYRR